MTQSQASSSSATGSKDAQGDGRFATLVWQAKKQSSRRGIIEIDEHHRLYNISRCIQRGIRECIDPHHKYEEETKLQDEDYLEVTTQTHHEKDIKMQFEFRCYAPKVFTALRALVGVTEAEYLESLAPSGPPLPCLEFITSSKSGMTFFLCNNKAFIMKTEKQQDILFLRNHFLRRLVRHFEDFPHSLLVKILGCYYIKLSGSKGLYFTVMESVFYPDERITERYDLKGCSASRYVQPLEEGSKEVIVLKDNNFDGKKIDLGPQAVWFRRQVDIDTKFLEDQGIMDYSLLLGIQRLHADEKATTNTLADVVSRARRSIKALPESPNRICPRCGGRLPTWNRRSNIITQNSPSQPTKRSHLQEETDRIVQEILDIDMSGDGHQRANSRSDFPHTTDSGEVAVENSQSKVDVTKITKNNHSLGSKQEIGDTTTTGEIERNTLPGVVTSGHEHQEDNGYQPNIGDQNKQGTSVSDPIRAPQTTHHTDLNRAKSSPQVRSSNSTFCQCAQQFQTDKCNERNQRLLPDTVNPLHIIDGDDERYFLGIIDVLTQYGLRKKVEYLYKSVRYPTETFSTVKPQHYAQRFRDFCFSKCN